ncbi:unnamed protein product [Calypogeia fissa]
MCRNAGRLNWNETGYRPIEGEGEGSAGTRHLTGKRANCSTLHYEAVACRGKAATRNKSNDDVRGSNSEHRSISAQCSPRRGARSSNDNDVHSHTAEAPACWRATPARREAHPRMIIVLLLSDGDIRIYRL